MPVPRIPVTGQFHEVAELGNTEKNNVKLFLFCNQGRTCSKSTGYRNTYRKLAALAGGAVIMIASC